MTTTTVDTRGHKPARPLPPRDGLRLRLFAGLSIAVLLVFGVGGWASVAKLSSAVIASGLVVIDSNVKKVQHPTGGVVGEIRVRNGDGVTSGQVVLRLDDTQTRAALGIIVSQLVELQGRMARLTAERDGTDDLVVPVSYDAASEEARRVLAGERRLLADKRKSLASQKGQLEERIAQYRQEIKGLTSQLIAKEQELRLIGLELDRVEDMYKRKLTPMTRVLAMQRDVTKLEGERGALVAGIGRSGGQIAEITLQITGAEQTVRTEAQRELRDIEGRIAELYERRIAAEDQLKRIDIKAPRDGIVHELSVHTPGGVITPAETLMVIVPSGDLLALEARISPQDIDQVTIGQRATLRFPAFNQRTTPELQGTVTRIGADLTREAQTGNTYFVARFKVDDTTVLDRAGIKLVPGMPVEVFITTAERTALSYMAKPFTDHLFRVFREE